MKKSSRIFFILFLFSAIMMLLSMKYLNVTAAQVGQTPTPDPMQERREKLMQAQEADIGPIQDLDSLSAIPCVAGFAGPYPCNKIDLMAFMPLGDIGGGSGNDIWGWTDPMDGKEYALMGRSSGTSFVDISDPENPVYLGNLPTHSSNSTWRDIKVYNNYAFVVSEASLHGMQVFDLTELRSVVSPPVTFVESAHYSDFGNAHNVAINEDSGYAYAVGTSTCSGGLHMVNISDPLNPVNAGCYSGDGYTHDTQCVIYDGPDLEHQGKEICFNSNEDTLTIVDVTNKNNPVLLSSSTYAGSVYTHQGWLTDDHENFLLGDEGDETSYGHNTRTYLWDLQDLDVPVLIGNYTATTPAIDHNMYVQGNYVYQSNYRAGLRILDVSGIGGGSLVEKGFFDTYPSNDNPGYDGTWSNYPYFNSGIVIVSGIDEGLFILQPHLAPDFELQASPETAGVCVPDEAEYNIDVLQFEGFSDPVTLSASGNPGGTTTSFSVNPVVPPGASIMTIGDTAAAGPGSYSIDVVGVAPTSTHTTTVGLNIYTLPPGSVTLVAPPDGAIEVDLVPTLTWSAAEQGGAYEVEIATDDSFSDIVYSATVSTTSHQIGTALNPESTYYWHIRAQNPCGIGTFSPTYSFSTRAIPPILLVDDDNNSPDVLPYFSAALDNLGYGYDVFDVGGGTGSGPSFGEMGGYQIVIWFSGDKFGDSAGPNSSDETNLEDYLNAGGKLFLSSQDYLYDFGLTTFGQNYLGISSHSNDTGNASNKHGLAGDPIGDGLGPYPLSYPAGFSDYGDIVNPGAGASVAFRSQAGGGNNLDIDKDGGSWKTVFFGTSWVPVYNANPSNGEEVLQRIIDWFGVLPNASIVLEKTVGTDEQVCAASNSLEVTAGTEVTYCYKVTNTGSVMLPLHDLVDTELGTLLDGAAYDLDPGEEFTYLTTTIILTDTTNSATWTAYIDEEITAQASDSAVVNVVNPSIDLDVTVGVDANVCAQDDTLSLTADTDVTYCYTISNTGDISFPLHTLIDSELGTLLEGFSFDLDPGASTFITATVGITETTFNTATWTAYVDDMITAQASDSASVMIDRPSIELNTTVGLESNGCAVSDMVEITAGTEVVYCYQVFNSGSYTLTVHNLVDTEFGVLLDGFVFELSPGTSTYITSTRIVLADIVNSATWTAFTEPGGAMAVSSDDAMVVVTAANKIYLPFIRQQ